MEPTRKMRPPTTSSGGGTAAATAIGGGSRKRQALTLDLNSSKRNKMQSLLTSPDVQMLKLTSPELEKFINQNPTLTTPTPNGPAAYSFPTTTTAASAQPPPPAYAAYPQSVTDEQKLYVRGFEEALEQMKKQDKNGVNGAAAMSEEFVAAATTLACLGNNAINHAAANADLAAGGHQQRPLSTKPVMKGVVGSTAGKYTSSLPVTLSHLDSRATVKLSPPPASFDHQANIKDPLVKVKDEPAEPSILGSDQPYSSPSPTSSVSSPPSSSSSSSRLVINTANTPIDMDTQEMIKLERKRMRNRLAASKCRKSKLEKIGRLDERVKQLKNENADLAAVVKKMKDNVALLKQEVIEHVNTGCSIRITDNML